MSKPTFEELEKAYRDLHVEFNTLVKEHNKLVDNHDNITEDAKSCLKFMEDTARGLKSFVFGLVVDSNAPINTIKVPENTVWDPARAHCVDVHNNIVTFMELLQQGIPAREAYTLWRDECKEVLNGINKQGGK